MRRISGLVAAGILLVAAWLGIATAAPAADAATPQCGANCTALYNALYGSSDVIAVAGASGTNANVGQPVALLPASNANPGEDWFLSAEGTVNDFYTAGIVSLGLKLHYGNDEVYEYDYTPDGVDSGLCLGLAGIAGNGAPVSLQPCGVDAGTLWVYDAADQFMRQVPLINGTDSNFSFPEVLTADTAGITMHTAMLTGGNGVIDKGQYWASLFGVL